MLRVSGRHVASLAVPIAILVLLPTAYGQALGDVARENREKKAAAEATAPPKVISNSDLAKDAPEREDESSKAQTPQKTGTGRKTATSPIDPRVEEQWRKRILEQKRTVAALEKRVARFQGALSYGDAGAISRGEILTRNQALEQERLARAQEQLEEQRAKLLEMQDEARKAGMYPKTYDP